MTQHNGNTIKLKNMQDLWKCGTVIKMLCTMGHIEAMHEPLMSVGNVSI